MQLKPDGQRWVVQEQIITDPVSELTIQFEVVPDPDAPYRLRIFGNVPFGNREFLFNVKGERSGAGTALTGSCHPTWLCEVEL